MEKHPAIRNGAITLKLKKGNITAKKELENRVTRKILA